LRFNCVSKNQVMYRTATRTASGYNVAAWSCRLPKRPAESSVRPWKISCPRAGLIAQRT